jgi:hypothetical protein
MLLQTNSYVVPKEKRAEHVRLLNRFRQIMLRFGCEQFEVFEQAGPEWGPGESSGRYVQLIRFRDRKHHQQVQAVEKTDPGAQKVIAEFCELINFPYQQQQGLFAVGFYNSVLPIAPSRPPEANRSLPHSPASPKINAADESNRPPGSRQTDDGLEIVESPDPELLANDGFSSDDDEVDLSAGPQVDLASGEANEEHPAAGELSGESDESASDDTDDVNEARR